MYKVFNMGIRMMVFVDKKSAQSILDLVSAFGIKSYILGEVRKSDEAAKVVIRTGDEAEPVVQYSA
jgi:phosphoribosylaminoimidazole (AIR) synthetase